MVLRQRLLDKSQVEENRSQTVIGDSALNPNHDGVTLASGDFVHGVQRIGKVGKGEAGGQLDGVSGRLEFR
jgi:hypothetical protein